MVRSCVASYDARMIDDEWSGGGRACRRAPSHGRRRHDETPRHANLVEAVEEAMSLWLRLVPVPGLRHHGQAWS